MRSSPPQFPISLEMIAYHVSLSASASVYKVKSATSRHQREQCISNPSVESCNMPHARASLSGGGLLGDREGRGATVANREEAGMAMDMGAVKRSPKRIMPVGPSQACILGYPTNAQPCVPRPSPYVNYHPPPHVNYHPAPYQLPPPPALRQLPPHALRQLCT